MVEPVTKLQILLAVEPPMLRDALRTLIQREPDTEIVDEVLDPIEILLYVKATEANLVIVTIPEREELPAICTHLLAEFPELVVIGICNESHRACTFRNTIDTQHHSLVSINDVILAMRTASGKCESHLATPE